MLDLLLKSSRVTASWLSFSSPVLYGVVLNDPQEVISEGSEAEARTETFLPSVFCALEDMMQNLDLVLHD